MNKIVTLNPGESKTVIFAFTPGAARSYQVSVDGLSGSFIAYEVPQAEFQVSNLVISPSEVYVGQPVAISLTVTNIGGLKGSYEVNCEVT